ncbi:MAG: hypothetical protein H0U42_05010 [Thermoleophilaceae bacterium]|nr:hypothetical protein [Thermoleophilaceae bacterium]
MREARLRGGARRTDLQLARAARGSGPVLVGPFVGEIGFELLYWIPLLRGMLTHHGIAPERVTAISRGGAEPWYSDIAEGYVDVLDLFSPEGYARRLEERRASAGDSKQLTSTALDAELLAGARERIGESPAAVVHPSLLYTRLRYFWIGERDPAKTLARLAFERLAVAAPEPDLGLPEEYVAVKVYFSDCFPDTPDNHRFARERIEQLAGRTAVVLLPGAFAFDDHGAPPLAAVEGVHHLEGRLPVRTNLAAQTRIIGGATALHATYGGFSYLAPLLGVPATVFHSEENFNPVHLDSLRALGERLGSPEYRVEQTESAPC